MSKKIVCDYTEFARQITTLTEDTFFEIQGSYESLSEDQLMCLNAPDEQFEEYYGTMETPLDQIALLLSSVRDGIMVELDLRKFEAPCDFSFFFKNLNSLKGIYLPTTISALYTDAFSDCINLEYIIIPYIIPNPFFAISVYTEAIQNCSKLKQFKIESELGSVDFNPIYNCPNLKKVEYTPKFKDANYYHLNPTEFNYEKIRIETERLIMRPLLLKDFEAVKKCYLDPRMLDYEEKEYSSEKNLKEELERAEKCWMLPKLSLCHFAICLKETEEIIGHLPLQFSDAYESEENCEDQTGHSIGWGITYEYQKKGYATEAAKAVVEWAKSFLKMNRLWAYADKENKASIHVMKKLGMTYETEFKYIDDEGQERIRVVYAVEEDSKKLLNI